MGGSDSKEAPKTANNGLLNGNEVYATSSVINHIDLELENLEILQVIAIVLKIIILVVILLKWFINHIKEEQNRNRRIEELHMRA